MTRICKKTAPAEGGNNKQQRVSPLEAKTLHRVHPDHDGTQGGDTNNVKQLFKKPEPRYNIPGRR